MGLVSTPALILVTVLVTDLGQGFSMRAQAEMVARNAAQSGAAMLPNTVQAEATARATARSMLTNFSEDDAEVLVVQQDTSTRATVALRRPSILGTVLGRPLVEARASHISGID